jgi:signal transduction histidine kinase
MDAAVPPPIAPPAETSWWHDFWTLDFMPHGCCYQWQPELLWAHVIADGLITLAYYSIPVILFIFIRKRRDVPFSAVFAIFAVFILSCGTTHLLEVISVWHPLYRLAALVKIITALVSMLAVVMLIPVLPQALALPSLAATNARLHATSEELRRSNAELEQFAYVASHDLQEPLRMVSLHLDLLQRRSLNPAAAVIDPTLSAEARAKEAEYIRRASEGATRMRALIADLLAYSRIDHVQTNDQVVDSAAALNDAMQDLRSAIDAAGATVTHGEMPWVRIERTQLAQVFQNLIGNALKFRRPGEPRIAIGASRRGNDWVFTVADNGIGIEARYFTKIFEVFQRLHDRSAYEGTGIGLATVKKIVERHHGRIWVESVPGEGSTFLFALPAGEPDHAAV